jgi:predicted DNA-binding transcriptional regulator AlpA
LRKCAFTQLFIFADKAICDGVFCRSHQRQRLPIPGAGSGDAIMHYDELLTVEEAATRLKISKHTLNRWRVIGEGPPFVKYGPRLVRYLEAALTDWEKRRTRRSTSDLGTDAAR